MWSYKRNLIQEKDMVDHSVTKYEFKVISGSMGEEVVPVSSGSLVDSKDEEDAHPVVVPLAPQPLAQNSLEKELIDRLLKKTDELSSNLAKLEIQFEKSRDSLKQASEDSYKRGFEEGKAQARAELQGSVDAEKEKIVQSLISLENTLKDGQTHLEELEKELGPIAVDMAKEVIIKEVDESSQKVAFELTRALLSNVVGATQVSIKVNPADYVFIKERLDDVERLQLEADNAISRGGVVISSNLGSLDGNVMSRYKMLKQSVLDTMKS